MLKTSQKREIVIAVRVLATRNRFDRIKALEEAPGYAFGNRESTKISASKTTK